MRAADVMTYGAATVGPDDPIEEAARLMIAHRVSGLPVVDGRGRLVGIVTEGDLLRGRGPGAYDRPRWLQVMFGDEGVAAAAAPRSVADVMTREVATATADTPTHELADIMETRGIKRLPVLRDGKVLGIVARADLLRGLARQAERMRHASPEDRALRDRAVEALAARPGEDWRALNVTARDGVVELRGATTSAELRDRLVAAARAVPGVREVRDGLVVVGPGSGRR